MHMVKTLMYSCSAESSLIILLENLSLSESSLGILESFQKKWHESVEREIHEISFIRISTSQTSVVSNWILLNLHLYFPQVLIDYFKSAN